MSDDRLRELERVATETGAHADLVRLETERLRLGLWDTVLVISTLDHFRYATSSVRVRCKHVASEAHLRGVSRELARVTLAGFHALWTEDLLRYALVIGYQRLVVDVGLRA